jgi:hypothetical protein
MGATLSAGANSTVRVVGHSMKSTADERSTYGSYFHAAVWVTAPLLVETLYRVPGVAELKRRTV